MTDTDNERYILNKCPYDYGYCSIHGGCIHKTYRKSCSDLDPYDENHRYVGGCRHASTSERWSDEKVSIEVFRKPHPDCWKNGCTDTAEHWADYFAGNHGTNPCGNCICCEDR